MQQNILLTSIRIDELSDFIEKSVRKAFKELPTQPIEQENAKDLFSIKEASNYLNLAIPTLYGLVANSSIPCMKKGKKLYFSRQELTDWVKSGRRKTATDKRAEINETLIKRKKVYKR